MIQTINIDKVSSGMNTKFVYFNWLEPPAIQPLPMKVETLQIFQDFPGCRKHSYIRQTTRGKYYFVKYVFKENNTICTLCEAAEALANRYGKDYQMTEKDFNCSDKFVNRSKSFSWLEALSLCRSINATLPEFYSRKEQEEFIAVVKSGNIFPIEAVYIGLFKGAKVRSRLFW